MDRRREKLLLACQRGELDKLRDELGERELRQRCLQMAISASNGGWAADDYVKSAETFVAFITRARPAKHKK